MSCLLSRRSRQRERLSASVLSTCSSVCLSVCRQNAKKTRFSQKLSNLELWCILTTYRKSYMGFSKNPYNPRWLRSAILKIDMTSIFFCRGWSDLDKMSETGAEWHVDCGNVSKSKPDVEFQYGGRLGEFNGMSSLSHVSHCRVLPLGKFTVTIPEPHATLQGVKIPSAILKTVFRHISFFCFNAV